MAQDAPDLTLAALPEDRRRAAMARLEVLRPTLEDDVPLARAAAAADVPLRTAQRWLARYRRDGLAGLARPTRGDVGRRRLPLDLVGLVEGLGLRRPRPSGELRDRTFEKQAYRASGLNLVVAAVILWNTRYLERAAADLGVGPDTMRHVAPLGWEHLSLTGDYAWDADTQPPPPSRHRASCARSGPSRPCSPPDQARRSRPVRPQRTPRALSCSEPK